MNCLWCGAHFEAKKKGNHEKKFCSAPHQRAFWSAARRWVAMAVGSGLLSVANLRACAPVVHGKEQQKETVAGRAA